MFRLPHVVSPDIDEQVFDLIEHITFDTFCWPASKPLGPATLGLIEGGLCNAENVEVLRSLRQLHRVLVAWYNAINDTGLPALRNHLDVGDMMRAVYGTVLLFPSCLPLNRVHIHGWVRIDHACRSCPPPADAFWQLLQDLMAGRTQVETGVDPL